MNILTTVFIAFLLSLIHAQYQSRHLNPKGVIKNILKQGQQIMIKIWVQKDDQIIFQKDYSAIYSQQQPQIVQNITIDAMELDRNVTIFASMFKMYPEMIQISHQQKNLTRMQKIRNIQQDTFYASSYDPIDQIMPNRQQKNQTTAQSSLHIARNFNILFIHSQIMLPRGQKPPPNMNAKIIQEQDKYSIGLDLSQMHIPFNTYAPVNGTHTVTLHIKPYDVVWYSAFYGIGHPQALFSLGPFSQMLGDALGDDSMDEMKQILFTNHVYLVVTFFLLSTAQSILRFFTIKQQYTFWKNIQKNQGISLKTLFFQLGATVILTLYVMEYNSSKLVIFFSWTDIGITVWKISRTFSMKIDTSLPFIHLQPSQAYKNRQKIDSDAVWYMNYILIPLMVVYVGWSLHSKNYTVTNYYIFFLQTSVAFIAIFGFIMMTPQLYINYKLKSVQHLNWRGLVYRFINTLLDDFFAIMVTMPMLRRLMYFRDDVIFIIYVYQRWIYKVDYKRMAPETYKEENREETKEIKTD